MFRFLFFLSVFLLSVCGLCVRGHCQTAAPVPPPPPVPLSVAPLLRDAEQRANNGRFTEAAVLIEKRLSRTTQKTAASRAEYTALTAALGKTCFAFGRSLAAQYRYRDAIAQFERAVSLYRDLRQTYWEAMSHYNIGFCHYTSSQFAKALTAYQRAFPLYQKLDYTEGLGRTLTFVGNTYKALSQFDKALLCYKQAISFLQKGDIKSGEAEALSNMASIEVAISRFDDALSHYEQALSLHQATKNRKGEVRILNNLGTYYSTIGYFQRSLSYHEQALELLETYPDKSTEAATLTNIGFVHENLFQFQPAHSRYLNALILYKEINSKENEAGVLSNLMALFFHPFNREQNRSLAVFYGKMSINIRQSLRRDNESLTRNLQRGFVQKQDDPYRGLTYLLWNQKRFAEAQQVFDTVKGQELSDFVRQNSTLSNSRQDKLSLTDSITLTVREQTIADTLTRKSKIFSQSVERRSRLEMIRNRTAEQNKTLSEIELEREEAQAELFTFLFTLSENFPKTMNPKEFSDLKIPATDALPMTLKRLSQGQSTNVENPIAVYTLIYGVYLGFLIVTPDGQRTVKWTGAKPDVIKAKVTAFQQVLRNPNSDPLPLAQELYNLLIRPIESEREAVKATSILWNLDGTLRYIPLAALHDGTKYLVEKPEFRNSLFTPLGYGQFADAKTSTITMAGFGVSKAHSRFIALPGVKRELENIVQGTSNSKNGVYPGKIFLDSAFTETALTSLATKKYPLVHIATHFNFTPQNETDSGLLLGDGTLLTIAKLREMSGLFSGVELLTLSACETGLGTDKNADGKEVEAFSTLAQNLGAKAVLASLWNVADNSTAALMQEFYRLRKSDTKIPKHEALRRAQFALLTGKIKPNAADKERGGKVASAGAATPKSRNWSHPYYWAPFTLAGNWK